MNQSQLPQSGDAGRYAAMLFPAAQDNLTGFINSSGEFAIEPRFRHALPFSEGIAAAQCTDFHWGFINELGEWTIDPVLSLASSFADGLAAVSIGGVKGYIDARGQLVLPGPYYKCDDFSGGIACVQRNWKDHGVLINQRGEVVRDSVFPLSKMADGLVNCRCGNSWGYANADGDWVIPANYKAAYPFSEGLAAVDDSGKGRFHFINTSGNVVISQPYEGVELRFSQGLCPVWDEAAGYINTSGNMCIRPQFSIAHQFSNGLASVQGDKGLFGYINLNGDLQIDFQFMTAEPFTGPLALVEIGDFQAPLRGYINQVGDFVWGPSRV